MIKQLIHNLGFDNFQDVLYRDKKFILIHFLIEGKNLYIGFYEFKGEFRKVFVQSDNKITYFKDVPYYYQNEVIPKYIPRENLKWEV
ncbi:MAG: hypothetical protein RMJ67_05725 [Elusimicrobiota bacterium]|nr:hypothetical protein [Endomicrobiia bacterium]MDW8165990.1 hypothetical protein [Elusimicrobiota bacterium]